jgi:acetyl/propionyl-CoA carboxylase alpha subunit/acetyl-CoA carboxylase carboxyltransferase component
MTGLPRKVLVANRGEIAIRIFRAAQSLGIATVGVRSEDDVGALHVRRCDEVAALPGVGPAAYLDVKGVVAAAVSSGADAIHPGYGFLSESADLARAAVHAGITFVGPDPDALETFGDKGRARALALQERVPVVPGTQGATTLNEMVRFMRAQAGPDGVPPVVMVKAIVGGGGRGVRVVRDPSQLKRAFEECRAEAFGAFGVGDLYIERMLVNARHVEVQVVGDGTGAVTHLWDRDCSVQRRHQKLIEIAPSSVLSESARADLLAAAVRLTSAMRLRGVATVEFLATTANEFFFLEVNPRLQVEHTVTEEVLGVDLVVTQLRLAGSGTLAEIGLTQDAVPLPSGSAIQVRVNAEQARLDGSVVPSSGTVGVFMPATGPGVRVDTATHSGLPLNPRFDSLLAKVVVHDRGGFGCARRLAQRALAETTIAGVATNLAFQRAILESKDFGGGRCDTGWVDRHMATLVERAGEITRYAAVDESSTVAVQETVSVEAVEDEQTGVIRSDMAGVVASVEVEAGQLVQAGTVLVVIEAMKMQHPLVATQASRVEVVEVRVGEIVNEGQVLALVVAASDALAATGDTEEADPGHVRPDLQKILDRRAKLLDEARPDAVAKRHKLGMRTARENVYDLVDGGLQVEYGGFAIAAQQNRRELADLEARTPADGIIAGIGQVNSTLFAAEQSTCAVFAYDYTVLAGTQGYWSHRKTDRLLEVAHRRRLPVVLFAEGGGGRPGDTDIPVVAGLHYTTFVKMGALSGRVPTIGIANGRCFAGNAALLGTCDVVIATEASNIGMGGPAMIEGGGLGVFTPEQIGPISVQRRNGVVDIVVGDEAEAVEVAKKYLSYFQGALPMYEAADQRRLRHVISENRKRVYDVRSVLTTLFDVDSVLELRREFGPGLITALARLQGQPVGVIANNPAHLGGAIDADGADKAARFLQLCDAYSLPVVSLCDTPGFMVGPDSERNATVRHFPRLFVLGGHMTVPFVTVVLRKAYGLGALAMAAGSFHNTSATLAWPTGEFGGMGLEGAVRLAMKDTLAAIEDPVERQKTFDNMVASAYEMGSAINTASTLEIDEVIDPAATRSALIVALLARPAPPRDGWANSRRSVGVDTW